MASSRSDNKVIDLKKTPIEGLINLANAYLTHNRPEKKLFLVKALKLHPHNPSLNGLYAMVLRLEKDYGTAMEVINAALSVTSDSTEKLPLYIEKITLCREMGQLALAFESYKNAHSLIPKLIISPLVNVTRIKALKRVLEIERDKIELHAQEEIKKADFTPFYAKQRALAPYLGSFRRTAEPSNDAGAGEPAASSTIVSDVATTTPPASSAEDSVAALISLPSSPSKSELLPVPEVSAPVAEKVIEKEIKIPKTSAVISSTQTDSPSLSSTSFISQTRASSSWSLGSPSLSQAGIARPALRTLAAHASTSAPPAFFPSSTRKAKTAVDYYNDGKSYAEIQLYFPAVEEFKKAAADDYVPACLELGKIYKEGRNTIPQDLHLAYNYYKQVQAILERQGDRPSSELKKILEQLKNQLNARIPARVVDYNVVRHVRRGLKRGTTMS